MRLSGAVSLKVCFGLGLASLMTALGCGSGGSVNLTHTTGNYSNASLKGTYVYEIRGALPPNGFPYREVGAFSADGAGHITTGSDDSSLNAGSVPITYTGSYSVGSDGTGAMTFSNTALGQITLALTLVSTSQVELMEADGFADGAGEAELQTASAVAANPGTFVFRLHQAISAQSSSSSAAEVGVVNVSGSSVTGGSMDQNLGGVSSQLTLTGGTLAAPGTLGRGTATLTDSTPFTTSLIYYTVATGKLVFLVSNANAVGSGEAEAQPGAVSGGLSGNYAFGSSGDDGFFDGTATVGSFTGSAGAISAYSFDAMQDGTYSTGTTTGTYTAAANGRVAVTLSSGSPEVFWMVSPARAFFLINSGSKIEDGTADLQAVSSFSASTMKGQYAMVMDGIDLNDGQDFARIGPLQFDGAGKLVLNELFNGDASGTGAQPPPGGTLSGTYQVSSNGRITGTLTNSAGGLDLVMYAISGSNAYVLQPDSGVVISGTVNLQH